MLELIAENMPTVIVSGVLAAIVGLIVYKMISDKKKGRSSCGGSCSSGCAGCSMSCSCRSEK